MQRSVKHLLPKTMLVPAALAMLCLDAALPHAAAAQTPFSAAGASTHIDSGTSISGFSGSSKSGQYLFFDLIPSTPGGTTTITASNLVYSGPWNVTVTDALSASYSAGVAVSPNYADLKSSSVTIPITQSDNYFHLPVTTFGDGFSFDLTLSGPATTTFDYKIFAKDDLVEIADLNYAQGSTTPTLAYAAPGTSVTGNISAAPEPSSVVALALGIFGLGALALKAKKRPAA